MTIAENRSLAVEEALAHVLEAAGSPLPADDVDLWSVAVQPGKPFAFGLSKPRPSDGRRVLLFGMPGNPVSAFVTFRLFVRPALILMQGGGSRPPVDRGVLNGPVRKAVDRRAYLRVEALRDSAGRIGRDDRGRVHVRESGGQGSHILTALAAADGLAVVPKGIDRLDAGSEVEIRWLRT